MERCSVRVWPKFRTLEKFSTSLGTSLPAFLIPQKEVLYKRPVFSSAPETRTYLNINVNVILSFVLIFSDSRRLETEASENVVQIYILSHLSLKKLD